LRASWLIRSSIRWRVRAIGYWIANHHQKLNRTENKGTPYEVLLGTLGRDFHPAEPSVAQQPSPTLYFPETGHNLSGKFKEYWEAHGGLFVNGFPITEPAMEKNPTDDKQYLVQWFERSRLELHPENAGAQYEVLLGLLGVQLTQLEGYSNGAYPGFGHAADFSWIAGHMTIYDYSWSSGPAAGCALVQYGTGGEVAQLNLPGGGAYTARTWERKQPIVIYGSLAQQGEGTYQCNVPPQALTYYVEHDLQFNPAP
jgi:hypothetical protein